MARISGIDLPKNKRGEIGLTYIYGIGKSTANAILEKAGIDVNKKVKDLARKSVLSAKASEGKITLLEAVNMGTPSTKDFGKMLKAISMEGKKSVFYTNGVNDGFFKSGRNLPSVTVLPVQNVSTYDLINSDMVVFEEGAVEVLQSILS